MKNFLCYSEDFIFYLFNRTGALEYVLGNVIYHTMLVGLEKIDRRTVGLAWGRPYNPLLLDLGWGRRTGAEAENVRIWGWNMIQLMEKCQCWGRGEIMCDFSISDWGCWNKRKEERFLWVLRFKLYFVLTFIYISQICSSKEIFLLEINMQWLKNA